MSETPWVHFTVEETEQGWIVWVKITTSARRYAGPATLYPFPSAEAAWRWVHEQFPDQLSGSDEPRRAAVASYAVAAAARRGRRRSARLPYIK